jgi:hypothetical protein
MLAQPSLRPYDCAAPTDAAQAMRDEPMRFCQRNNADLIYILCCYVERGAGTHPEVVLGGKIEKLVTGSSEM